jgi:hypothetical protein
MRRMNLAVVIFLIFGALLCIYYLSIVPALVAIAVVALLWIWNWHRMVYLNPESVTINEQGISMKFRYGEGTSSFPGRTSPACG